MGKYDDIINMPHHVSTNRSHIPNEERAAQFSAFAALTGFDEMIDEEGRWVDKRLEPDESRTAAINEKLKMIADDIETKPIVTVEYFTADTEKDGGIYTKMTDSVEKIDSEAGSIIFENGAQIFFKDIYEIIF